MSFMNVLCDVCELPLPVVSKQDFKKLQSWRHLFDQHLQSDNCLGTWNDKQKKTKKKKQTINTGKTREDFFGWQTLLLFYHNFLSTKGVWKVIQITTCHLSYSFPPPRVSENNSNKNLVRQRLWTSNLASMFLHSILVNLIAKLLKR